jgi:hypothetical protein
MIQASGSLAAESRPQIPKLRRPEPRAIAKMKLCDQIGCGRSFAALRQARDDSGRFGAYLHFTRRCAQ